MSVNKRFSEVIMPELPEVETIKTAISCSIGHSNIINVIVNNNKLREKIPDDFVQRVSGTKITRYKRIAKYIVMELNSGLSIILHLGMSGRIKISDTFPQPLAKHDHVIIETDNGYITLNDARRFGVLTYVETDQLSNCRFFKKIGIEPFDEKLTADYLYRKLQKKQIPVKVAIMDQALIVGIGNIYASETLYLAGISPLRSADKISKKECGLIIDCARRVLEKAIKAGGSTLRDYQKPDGSLGYFQNQHCVYNKTGQKCPDCTCNINQTGGIVKIVQGGRSSFYCPHKQK